MQIAQKSVSKSIQNECAADTAGGVQRGLGMLPQQAIYEDRSSGEIKKMCKPVQVYTACQFVTPIICGQTYSQVGNKFYCANKTGKQGKVIALCSFSHFLLRLNLQNALSGKAP